jgi:hypothetical protein
VLSILVVLFEYRSVTAMLAAELYSESFRFGFQWFVECAD